MKIQIKTTNYKKNNCKQTSRWSWIDPWL